ncbi:MAG: hypothetical protein AB7F43_06675 [Bacteriovoracia bacterium]
MREAKVAYIVVVSFFFLIGCSKEVVVATVGRYEITKKDVENRKKILEIYFPKSNIDGDIAKRQLIKAYTQAEILSKYGIRLDKTVLKREASRIEKNTKMPQTLTNIKAIFQRFFLVNEDDYLKVFVLPTLASRKIYYDLFLENKEIQKKPKEQAALLAKSVLFEKTAKRLNAKIEFVDLDKEVKKPETFQSSKTTSGLEHYVRKELTNAEFSVEKQTRDLLNKLWPAVKKGTSLPTPVPLQEHFLVIHKPRTNSKNRILQLVYISKTGPYSGFEEWYEKEKKTVSISYE